MSYLIHTGQNALILNADNPAILLAKVEGARPLNYQGKALVAAPYSVTATQQLRKFGFPIPSPIGYQYDWPLTNGKFTPLVHCRETAAFLTLNQRAYVLSEIGTHKTASTLYAADFLMRKGVIRRALITSTLSTLEQVWGDTVFFTFRDRKGVVLHGTAEKRLKLLKQNFDFYVINHDALDIITDRKYDKKQIFGDPMNPKLVTAEVNKLVDAKLKREDIDLVVIDELAEYRNYDTEKYAIMKKLIQPRHWVWGLTATPQPKAPVDVWAQCRLITPWTVPNFYTMWRQMTMQQLSTYKWIARKEAKELTAEALQPSVRYLRADCYDLPPTTYAPRVCEMSAEQKKHFSEMMNQLVTEMSNGSVISAMNAGVKQSKLLQILCGVVYDKKGEEVLIDSKPRLKLVQEIIEQAGQKVIIFVPFTHALHHVAEFVRKLGYTVEVVHGGVSKNARADIYNRFQNTPDPHVIVADARTMSHGLTLTQASTIIWYAPAPSNNIYTQANGRITRSGQVNNTYIIHISATALERRVYARHQDETSDQGVLLELLQDMMVSTA